MPDILLLSEILDGPHTRRIGEKKVLLLEKNVFFLKVTDFGANPPLGNTLPSAQLSRSQMPKAMPGQIQEGRG